MGTIISVVLDIAAGGTQAPQPFDGSDQSDREEMESWCATPDEFRLARQIEGCLVDAQETSVLLEDGGIMIGKVLLIHKTLIETTYTR